MIIKRKLKTVRVYHTTKDINIPSIKKLGLLCEYYKKPSGLYKEGNRARPFPEVIYLSKDLKHLIKFPEQGKSSTLVFDLPVDFYNKLEAVNLGDPLVALYKNKEDYALNNVLEFMKIDPRKKEYFETYVRDFKNLHPEYKNLPFEDVFKLTDMYKGLMQAWIDGGKEWTIAVKADIPPQYLTEIIDERKYNRLTGGKYSWM